MITFRPHKQITYEAFLNELTSYINILLFLILSLSIFFPEKLKYPASSILLFIFLQIITISQKRKIVEIGFDTENNYLHFYSKGYFTKLKKMKTPFDNMCVEKDKKFPSKMVIFRAKNYTLYIKKDKKEVFKVDMNEDGFTEQTMDALVTQFEQTGIPII